MLTEAQQGLWEAYLHAEGRAPRCEKLRALEAFLDSLASSPPSDWHPWAVALAGRVVDGGEDLVIRTPLFERAAFPALLAGCAAGHPGCARWLAGLSRHLYRCPRCLDQLPAGERTELGLLRAAARHDPSDAGSRRRLVAHLADRLRHSLHEVPSGVLYGMDGATPEQCLELRQELEEFCRLVAADEGGPDYRELIDRCRFHFAAYRDYLLHADRYVGYRQYLAERGAG